MGRAIIEPHKRPTLKICTQCDRHLPLSVCRTDPECQTCIVEVRREQRRNAEKIHRDNTIPKQCAKLDFLYWHSIMEKIPDDYHRLSDDEWQDACSYFYGKCAYCGVRAGTHKSLFVTVEYGGKMADWNVVPACMQCIGALGRSDQIKFYKLTKGKVEWYETATFTKEKRDRIIEYLAPKLHIAAGVDMPRLRTVGNRWYTKNKKEYRHENDIKYWARVFEPYPGEEETF